MIGESLLWIGSSQGVEETLTSLRSVGLPAVPVQTVDSALRLLAQFSFGTVVLRMTDGQGWEECARVLACGSPVAVLVDSIRPESAERYLNAGCAAVVLTSCTTQTLTAALRQVTAGKRGIVYGDPPRNQTATAGAQEQVARARPERGMDAVRTSAGRS